MNELRAQNIIAHRTDNGPFKSRDDIKKVKSIGAKTFEQCAGFIRIDCTTANLNGKYNILDSTWVHPESYDLTKKLINKLKLSLNDVGTTAFISKIREVQQENGKTARLATEFRVPEERVCELKFQHHFFPSNKFLILNFEFLFLNRSKVSSKLLVENFKKTTVMMQTFGHFSNKAC